MGNAFALKIIKINDNCMLKDVVFNHGNRVVELVYFITKLNKYYVENFRKNCTINEFTLYNVYTKKEYNVAIERVESGYFFEGLEYKLEILPNVEKVLLVSSVSKDGPGSTCGIKPGGTILLGNAMNFFSGLKDVEDEINKMNADFIFYDFKENCLKRINFEEFRDRSSMQLRMGIEIEVKNVKDINFETNEVRIENILTIERKIFNTNSNEELTCHSNSITNNEEKVSNSSNILQEIKHMDDQPENQIDKELFLLNEELTKNKILIGSTSKHEESKEEKTNEATEKISFISSNDESNNVNEITGDIFLVSNDDKSENKHGKVLSHNNVFVYHEIIPLCDGDKNKVTSCSHKTESVLSPNVKKDSDVLNNINAIECKQDIVNDNGTPNKNDEYFIDLKETISPITNLTKYSNTQSSFNSETEKLTNSPLMRTTQNLDNQPIQSDYTHHVKKCKRKYSKKLSIYDQIDSNYNFMTISKTNKPQNEKTPKSTLDKSKLNSDVNIEKTGAPKKKVLIKGYQLSRNNDTTHGSNYFKSFKIFDLHQNTKTIDIY